MAGPREDVLLAAAVKAGEFKVATAFKQSTFIYGTQGSGSVLVQGLAGWANRAHARLRAKPQAGMSKELIDAISREVKLYEPGRRAAAYVIGGYQMMDLYYGQAGSSMHEKRDPVIAEFMHYAMAFKGPFPPKQTGRESYMETFKTAVEGWDEKSPAKAAYNGLTATKEMSRIIRWGIERFGGKIIFEGRGVYYSQVFNNNAMRVGDTDLEAQELFKYFKPGLSTAPFGRGKVVFFWGGNEIIPTKIHFLTNWNWAGGKTHSPWNAAEKAFAKHANLREIWDNFQALPKSLGNVKEEDAAAVAMA